MWLGEADQGQPDEAGRQRVQSILIEGVAEALELAGRLGIDDSQLAGAIEGGPLDAPIADARLHTMEHGVRPDLAGETAHATFDGGTWPWV